MLLLTTLIATSCLSSSNKEFELSSDDTIHEFAIDTVYGKRVIFSIDNIENQLFNLDSLPIGADTIINKIQIKNIATMGAWIYHADTLFNYLNDSIDLRSPFELTVKSMDQEHKRTYYIDVRVHRQDPDSLSWKLTSPSYTPSSINDASFMGNLGKKIFTFTSTGKAFTATSPHGNNWEEITPTGLPANPVIKNLITQNNQLYLHIDNKLYESIDGVEWTESKFNTIDIDVLIAVTPTKLMAISTTDGKQHFFVTDLKEDKWVKGNEVPTDFPKDNISSTFYERTKTTMMMGTPTDGGNTYSWMSESGMNWVKQESKYTENDCPFFKYPHLIYYNSQLYAFGGDYSTIYKSLNGIDWKEIKTKFMLPEDFKDRKQCAITIDNENYIWVSWNNSAKHTNEVWRGRLNKLGFRK